MLRPVPDRLDHPERNFHVRRQLRGRAFQDFAGKFNGHHAGPPAATGVDCLCLRCVFRGCGRIWRTGRRDRGHSDRHGFQTAASLRFVPDRQHRSGGFRGSRDAARRPARRERIESTATQRHGRANIAVLFRAGAILADLDFRRLQRNDRSVACGAGGGRIFCDPAIFGFKPSRPLAG